VIDALLLEKLAAAEAAGLPAGAVTGCTCDFCTGKKKHADNWCARCAAVRMQPPKWWENEDVCDACERAMAAERPVEGEGP
jgi:hypothetical protein